ncbi:hypothetical protein NU768_000856 [Vibrio vulnificus]|nr:hypothetical protein [Vibrio vulnificus]
MPSYQDLKRLREETAKATDKAKKRKTRQDAKYSEALLACPPIDYVIDTLRGYHGITVTRIYHGGYEVRYNLADIKETVMISHGEDPASISLRLRKSTDPKLVDILREVRIGVLRQYNGLASFGNNLDHQEIVS